MSTVLVTGGAGFLGSHICEKLLMKDYTVLCLDNLSSGNMNNIANCMKDKKFVFIKADANTSDLENVFRKNEIDFVFHYSFTMGNKINVEEPVRVLNDVKGIQNVFDLSRKYDVKKIVYASSSEVYGEPVKLPDKEDEVVNPKVPYAVIKLLGEKFVETYFEQYNLKACALRIFNTYGPRQVTTSTYSFVVGNFIQQVFSDKQPTVLGDGNQTRDFLYIDDNIEATMRAFEFDSTNGQVINIAKGERITINELANKIINLCGKNLTPTYLPFRKHEIIHRVADVSKMKKLLKFEPRINLEEGLKKTIDWYKKNLKS
jgi:nucleoside-diphosphate-sugar epimerase